MLSAVEWTERDVALYRAVTKARECLREGHSASYAAQFGCIAYEVVDNISVKRLAVAAEKACEAARVWIKENVK